MNSQTFNNQSIIDKIKKSNWILSKNSAYWDNKEIVMAYLENKKIEGISKISDRLKDDEEIALKALEWDAISITMFSKRLQNSKDFILKLVAQNGDLISKINNCFRDDRDVVLTALTSKSDSFTLASHNLRDDKEIVLQAVSKAGMNCTFASPRLQLDLEVVATAILENNRVLKHLPEEIKNKFKNYQKEFKAEFNTISYQQTAHLLLNQIKTQREKNNIEHLFINEQVSKAKFKPFKL